MTRNRTRMLAPGAVATLALAIGLVGPVASPAKPKPSEPIKQVLDSKQVVYPNPSTATAVCPNKTFLIFGGFKLNTKFPLGSGVAAWVDSAAPKGQNKFAVRAHNDYAAEEGKLVSYGYCQGGEKPTTVRAKSTLEAGDGAPPPEEAQLVTAQCPMGKTLVGGGYSISGDNRNVLLLGMERSPASKRVLNLYLINERTVDVVVTAIARCKSGPAPTAHTAFGQLNEPDQKAITVKCPGKKKVVFGGFLGEANSTTTENAFIYQFFRSNPKTITVAAGQTTWGPPFTDVGDFKAIAYCRA